MIDWKNAKNILIYGYAREGRSSARYMRRVLPQSKFTIHDDQLVKYSSKVDFSAFDCIVISSGIPRNIIPVLHRKKCVTIVEIFFDCLTPSAREKVIGVTGTKGKSTTVTFITACLQSAGSRAIAAGNIGVPVLDVLPQLLAGKLDYVVLELSSYQLEFLRKSPKYAVFLNIFPDHLDRHGTMKKYLKAKSHAWAHQLPGDIFFVPKRWRSSIAQSLKPKVEMYSTQSLAPSFFPKKSVFQALYWRENFGAAVTLLKKLGVAESVIKKVANTFVGLPHRLEFFTERKGIRFYDDSIAVNVDATLSGATFLRAELGSIILGGYDRGQDFDALLKFLIKASAYICILDTPTASRIVSYLERKKYQRYTLAKNLRDAVLVCAKSTSKGRVCLLSCAAPSFGMFKNFEQRGDIFKKLVTSL